MYLCSDDHEEICHEERKCPMCKMMRDVDRLEREVADLEGQLEEAKAEQ